MYTVSIVLREYNMEAGYIPLKYQYRKNTVEQYQSEIVVPTAWISTF